MSLRPQLDLFATKLPKMEDVDWLTVFQLPEFKAIGLCQRHVQIDDSGRDWFGMPFLVDEDCARVQGSPYVAKLDADELELNRLLWQLETLSQREQSITARADFAMHAQARRFGNKAYTPAEYFEQRVRLLVEAKYYPSPSLGGRIALYEGRDTPDFDAEGNSIPSPFEKYISLDYVTRVILSLEYCIQWKRQDIYYHTLLARERSELVREQESRQARSQAHWADIDAERERLRRLNLRAKRENPEAVVPLVVEQLDMFGEEVRCA